MRLLLVSLLCMLLCVSVVQAAFLQYNTVTLEVTGFRARPIPDQEGRTVVADLPANFLSTVTLPAGCTFVRRDFLSLFRVTNPAPPPTFAIGLNPAVVFECFNGQPVFTKHELREAFLEALTTRQNGQPPHFKNLNEVYVYVAQNCPAANVTARCNALRTIFQSDPPLATIGDLAIQVLTIRGSLP